VLKDFYTFQARSFRASLDRSRDNSRSNSRCGTPGPNQVGFLFLQNCRENEPDEPDFNRNTVLGDFGFRSATKLRVFKDHVEVILKKQPYLMNGRN